VSLVRRSKLATSSAALLDAIPDAVALLDAAGVIVGVNRAWNMFALDNGGSVRSTGVGVNYLEVCDRSAAAGCADAAEVARGVREVLAGGSVERDLEYPCPSPAVGRWFLMRVTSVAGAEPGALVSHVNISRRKTAELYLERKASEDPLTGLANRALLLKRLTSALVARPEPNPVPDVGLLFLDLDGFKLVNDTFGHASGDELLLTVAARMRLLVRPQDTIARLGGDEFVVMTPRTTALGLAGLADRIETSLGAPHVVHGRQLEVPASVGSYLATAGEQTLQVLHRADAAMYIAKRARVRAA